MNISQVESRPTMKHTPGPWTTGNALVPFGITIWKEHDPERNTPRICHNVSTLANATLICAAPEMLEALKSAHQMFCDAMFIWGKDDDKKVGHMTKAIAHALKKAGAL